jgi:hypothetical protein
MGAKHSPQLHVCPACNGNLVQAIDLEPRGAGHWYVELSCPNCWWRQHGLHGQVDVDSLDEELSRGEATLLATLEELTRAHMLEEAERFARALSADAIVPMDF